MKVQKQDVNLLKAIMLLLREGTFELKGTEVPNFQIAYNWLHELQERFDSDLDKKPKEKKTIVKKKVKKK